MADADRYRPPEIVFDYPPWPCQPSSDAFFPAMKGFLASAGVTSASYRRVLPFHRQLDSSASLYHFGFPESWVELYDLDFSFREHDPIADFIIGRGRFMTWSEAIAAQDLTASQQKFADSMLEHGLIDGVALPLYGPRGREAYATYSFGRKIVADDLPAILFLNDFFQLRHSEIAIAEDSSWRGERPLSPREKEVLFWIAKGKSNHDIADIIGIRRPTVSEYVKRIFMKLEVCNRMDAASVGLQRGFINLSSS